jgi:hypothetical protein
MHRGSPIYEWKQTLGSVLIYVKPPPSKENLVKVEILERELKLGLKDSNGWFIDEETFGVVNTSESKWSLQEDEHKGGKVIFISLCKVSRGELWETALTGGGGAAQGLDATSKEQMRKEMLAAEEEQEEDKRKEVFSAEEKEDEDEEEAKREAKRKTKKVETIEEAWRKARQEAKLKPVSEEEKEQIIQKAQEYLSADIRLFSSCQDDQQANDNSNVHKKIGLRMSKRSSKVTGYDGGVFTSVLLKILYGDDDTQCTGDQETSDDADGGGGDDADEDLMTYADLLFNMKKELKGHGYQQVPVFTTSRPMSMKDGFDVIPKDFSGQRRALIIGINYSEETPFYIPGCQNDAWNMIRYLKACHGFQDDDIAILMDNGESKEPTRQNILKAFHRFAFSVKPGDAAFFYYAGHGKSSVNEGLDDESAEFDQVMLPMDFVETGGIVDDEIFRVLLIPLQSGVQVTAVVDCCHSGSIFDLPFEFVSSSGGSSSSTNNNDKDNNAGEEIDFRAVRFPHMGLVRHERNRLKAVANRVGQRRSVIEQIMIKPPTKKKKTKTELKGGEPENAKYMQFAAVEDPKDPEEEKKKEERELVLLGCCLLCLNPIKLCRVLWS